MNKKLVILGAGGHAKVCYEIAQLMSKWNQIIVLDDNSENVFFTIEGRLDDIDNYPLADFFVAIGSNEFRKKIIEKLHKKKYSIATLVHPSAIISPTVQIEEGTVIMPGVVINSTSKIGRGCILNTGCTIDHDNELGNFVHISPGTHLAGNIKIGSLSWLGTNSTVINNKNIASRTIIGAGGVVVQDIKEPGTYIGIPVKQVVKE